MGRQRGTGIAVGIVVKDLVQGGFLADNLAQVAVDRAAWIEMHCMVYSAENIDPGLFAQR